VEFLQDAKKLVEKKSWFELMLKISQLVKEFQKQEVGIRP
jgi:hypothetical protein